MKKSDVLALLQANQNQRGIDNWQKLNDFGSITSFGIGLTQLRKLAKQIGRDHELALELFKSDCYDAKVLGLLIDDPKQLTPQQVESQVDEVGVGMLTHVFSSCDATLAKAPFALDKAIEWLKTDDDLRLRSGFGLMYELSKNKRNKALTDELFIGVIEQIDQQIDGQSGQICFAMGTALMGIGKRNKILNQKAVAVATRIGPIDFSEDGSCCDPFNVLKHLTKAALKNKLGV